MANINVKSLNVENGGNQILGDPFEVTVTVNNRELVAPAPWNPARCTIERESSDPLTGDTVAGHKAEVEVELLRNGGTVESKSREVCAPLDATPVANPTPTFEFDPTETGTYDVRATITPQPDGPTDTETYTIEVSDTGEQDPPPNDNDDNDTDDSGMPPWGDADNDGTINLTDPAPNDPSIPEDDPSIRDSLNKGVILLGLLAVAWLASSASDTVEAVT